MGPRRCNIEGCKSVSGRQQHRGVTYHTIPLNPIVRACWMSNCRMPPNKHITKSVLICSRHFRRADFQPLKNNKYLLRTGAVPTIFPWGSLPYVQPTKLTQDESAVSGGGGAVGPAAGLAGCIIDAAAVVANAPPNSDHVVSVADSSKTPNVETTAGEVTTNEENVVKQILVDALKAEMKSPMKRSVSADTSKCPAGGSGEPKAKLVRKSLDSAFSKAKAAAAAKAVQAPSASSATMDPVTLFVPGSAIEAQDFNEIWHPAKVVEVDFDEREVLIHFETNKSKPIIDEWIPMNSSRLRQVQSKGVPSVKSSSKRPISTFELGERCTAKWTDSRKWKATVSEVLENEFYIVLFDDGYTRKCAAKDMSKIKPPIVVPATPPPVAIRAPTPIVSPPVAVIESPAPKPPNAKQNVTTAKATPTGRKINPPLPIPKFDLEKLNLLPVPKDGEWCCNWVNDTPIGAEAYLEGPDGNRRPTVLVEDWRLPIGWTKHLYQRSSVSGKWDVVLVGPTKKRFRSKNDVKVYLEDRGDVYNPDVYDFSIHKRRAKDIGLFVLTEDYKEVLKQKQILAEAAKVAAALAQPPPPPPPPPIEPLIQPPPPPLPTTTTTPAMQPTAMLTTPLSLSPIMSNISNEDLFTGFSSADQSLSEAIPDPALHIANSSMMCTPVRAIPEAPQLEEGFVYVGALKVQLIDNLFRCPDVSCNKNFRKENHLQIHVKHYHDDLSKLLGVCPNMSELAYLRTMGQPSDEASPKNQIPNSQFFEKVYQSDITSKALRKSMSSPTGSLKTERADQLPVTVSGHTELPSLSSLPADLLLKNMDLLEDALNNKDSSFEQSFIMQDCIGGFVKPPGTSSKIEGHLDFEASIDAASLNRSPVPMVVAPPAAPKSSRARKPANRSNKSRIKIKLNKPPSKPKASRVKALNRSAPDAMAVLNQSLNEFEENARHSFGDAVTPSKPSSRLKVASSVDAVHVPSGDTLADGLAAANATHASPRYISENGEMIKIVRMRQEEIINCLCSYGEEDGLMIQCELCLCWQHGVCNGIEKESEVPDKYVCYICKNPQRGRESMKYVHDQDWLYEGRLPMASFHRPSAKHAERFDMLKQSHQLTGNLLELKKFMHSLKVKMNIAENKDHPKMYLWSKKWERCSPPASQHHHSHTLSGIESLSTPHMDGPDPRKLTDSDLNLILNEDQKNIDEVKEELPEHVCNDTVTDGQSPPENVATKDDEPVERTSLVDDAKPNVNELPKAPQHNDIEGSILAGLLNSPGGTNIDLVGSVDPPATPTSRITQQQQQHSAINVPQPEAAIDPAECQLRLLEHIQKQQSLAMTRLQTIEAQIIGLEAMDEKTESFEPTDSFERTKQIISMLLTDLTKMRKLSSINVVEAMQIKSLKDDFNM